MMMSFSRLRLGIVLRGSFSTAAFRSVASKNLIGACSQEAQVPSVASSMKATAPTIRSWSSMGLDQKEEKQIDGSEKIPKADGMGEAAHKRDQEDFSKFDDDEFLKRSLEEGRIREVFQEREEAHGEEYANAEEEEGSFREFESAVKLVVETNSKGGLPQLRNPRVGGELSLSEELAVVRLLSGCKDIVYIDNAVVDGCIDLTFFDTKEGVKTHKEQTRKETSSTSDQPIG